MTSTHASKRQLDTLPAQLREVIFPSAKKAENFVMGSAVKGRNEPSSICGVAWVIKELHEGKTLEDVASHAWRNTIDVFSLEELEKEET